ncbi:MAG: hypothetical protein PHI97_26950 [Desulfobulbus sp.]|nr:hypothetical protein [Desulfobulbus sp.]
MSQTQAPLRKQTPEQLQPQQEANPEPLDLKNIIERLKYYDQLLLNPDRP